MNVVDVNRERCRESPQGSKALKHVPNLKHMSNPIGANGTAQVFKVLSWMVAIKLRTLFSLRQVSH